VHLKKVCLISTNLTLEGNVVFYLAKALAEKGITVTVVAPHAKGLKKKETVDGVCIERFRYFSPARLETLALRHGILQNLRKNPLNYLLVPFFMFALMAKSLLMARNSDILHAHWLPAGIAALPAKYLFRRPVVLTVHGHDVRNQPKSIVGFFLKRFDAVITGHNELLEIAQAIVPEKTFLIRNAMDFDALEKMPDKETAKKKLRLLGKKTVSLIGRITEMKQPMVFVEALPLVMDKHKDANFLMVGDGPLQEKARQRAKELGVEKNIVFAGRVNNVFDYLAATDLFAAISHIENAFSVSLVEALLSGVPCVMTKAGTTDKFFSHKKNCFFVPKESPQALAVAISMLLGNKKTLASIGKNGKVLAKELGFDKEKILNKTISTYLGVLTGNG
jgi:glycosyltransferase involved in cell wall biosynthesis